MSLRSKRFTKTVALLVAFRGGLPPERTRKGAEMGEWVSEESDGEREGYTDPHPAPPSSCPVRREA